ncbi:hypothetical protein EVAR_68499_1 [Eumeta japonica]|uniref:Uncharacterized protein n=1 Tax=Eumeta variegata TaxID=151549 RepID=A0A4C2A659_EUMVA|nr:hypothetical protein EVAR_68499_1 [Eumeta japonica]
MNQIQDTPFSRGVNFRRPFTCSGVQSARCELRIRDANHFRASAQNKWQRWHRANNVFARTRALGAPSGPGRDVVFNYEDILRNVLDVSSRPLYFRGGSLPAGAAAAGPRAFDRLSIFIIGACGFT